MKKRLFKVILITALVILVILLSIKILDLIHFRCLFKYLFNFYCAGCGTTRMIKSLIKLDFYQSFRYNPGVFILSIMLFIYLILLIYNYIFKGIVVFPNTKILIVIIIVLFIYMILRNIPYFNYLVPTKV